MAYGTNITIYKKKDILKDVMLRDLPLRCMSLEQVLMSEKVIFQQNPLHSDSNKRSLDTGSLEWLKVIWTERGNSAVYRMSH